MDKINKHFHKALLEAIPCSVFVVNRDREIVFWNNSAQQLTQYSAEEIVGKSCDSLRMNICASRDPSIKQTICPLLDNCEGGEVECEIKRKDGSTVPVIRRARAVFDDDGKLIGAIESLVDISLIKKARSEIRTLQHEIAHVGKFGALIGSSQAMRKLYDLISIVAKTDASVVIQGETGTGKEVVAKTIHAESGRSDEMFLAVNCGALTESLLEAELFGHKKGAFTGAIEDRRGCFETASGGTIFLDEIAEMPMASQVKLLRVLQESQVTPVGDSLPRDVDVRIIAATNRNLAQMVQQGKFREDLYYRLRIVELAVPSLRDRKEDIPDLVSHFINQFNQKYKKNIEGCSAENLESLISHEWFGNIRELKHAIEHAFVVTPASERILTKESLPAEFASNKTLLNPAATHIPLQLDEKEAVTQAIKKAGGNKSQAARILGITRAGLYKKMKRLGLK